MIIESDCLDVKQERLPDYRLVYVDPPYGPTGMDEYYGTCLDRPAYLSWLEKRLRHLTFRHFDYSIIVHVDPKMSHYVKVMMDSVFGYSNFVNEIVWFYCGPSNAARSLPRKHDVLLWYGMGEYKCNMQYIPYHSLGTAAGSSWGGLSAEHRDELLRRGKKVEDVWIDIPALVRNEGEKTGYPTQKPLALLDRVISLTTDPGDYVLDPMAGSGTTGLAASRLGRSYCLIDSSPEAVRIMKERGL